MNPKLNLISLLGNAGCGKDTVAEIVLKATQGTSLAFADPLKELAAILFQFSKEQLYGPSEKRNEVDTRKNDPEYQKAILERFAQHGYIWMDTVLPPGVNRIEAFGALIRWLKSVNDAPELSARLVLQTLGTEWGRTVYAPVWVEYGFKRARMALEGGIPMVVVKDCRFINEAKACRDAGGEVWYIDRPSRAALTAGVQNHASEREQTSDEMKQHLNVTIYNHGTLEDLEHNVLGLLKERFPNVPQL
jgi:hypothetical protein